MFAVYPIRSLRASTQRSTSVLFSFVLSLLIVAASSGIRQSKTILARSCAALTRLLTCACARVVALSRRPKGEIFRAVEPGRENDPLASRGKLQDITPCIPNGFRYEEITRGVKGHAMRIVKIGSERALHACGSEHKNCIVWPSCFTAWRRYGSLNSPACSCVSTPYQLPVRRVGSIRLLSIHKSGVYLIVQLLESLLNSL